MEIPSQLAPGAVPDVGTMPGHRDEPAGHGPVTATAAGAGRGPVPSEVAPWRSLGQLHLWSPETAQKMFLKQQEMSTSIQKTAEELQDKVVAISKEINPLALKITTLPAQMAAPNANKAEIQKLFALSPQQPSFHVPSALMGALGATVLGASALVVSRAGSRSHSSVALMEEGTLE
eukprot:Skav235668  [mRNA]  locus=scaffold358:1092219:1099763:+ [translate_table: standard]